MVLILIAVIVPLTLILFICNVVLSFHYKAESEREKTIIWGGLHGIALVIWYITFTLSSIGLGCSFYLYAQSTEDSIPVVIFAVFHISLICYDFAVIRHMKRLVLACLLAVTMAYIALFVYTIQTFPLNHLKLDAVVFITFTHSCNAIGILHSLIMDLWIWQRGWWSLMDSLLYI